MLGRREVEECNRNSSETIRQRGAELSIKPLKTGSAQSCSPEDVSEEGAALDVTARIELLHPPGCRRSQKLQGCRVA